MHFHLKIKLLRPVGGVGTAEFALRLRSVWLNKMCAFSLKNEASEAGRWGDDSRNLP